MSSGTGVPSWNHGWQRSQPVPCAQGSCLKLAGSGSRIRLLANAKPGRSAVPPGSNTLNAVRSEVSFSSSVLTMPTPARRAFTAALAVSVLPRSTPCRSHQPKRTSSRPLASIRRGGVQRCSLTGVVVHAATLGE